MEQMRFRFDGQAISENETPSQLEMEDGDTIDVFHQQTGGWVLSPLSGLLDCMARYQNLHNCLDS